MGVNPFEFLDEPYVAKTGPAVFASEEYVILACVTFMQ